MGSLTLYVNDSYSGVRPLYVQIGHADNNWVKLIGTVYATGDVQVRKCIQFEN